MVTQQQLAQKQYEEAKTALEKLDNWKLQAVRREMKIETSVKREKSDRAEISK
jgi:hypothetical protein